jgi:hypothetical protein
VAAGKGTTAREVGVPFGVEEAYWKISGGPALWGAFLCSACRRRLVDENRTGVDRSGRADRTDQRSPVRLVDGHQTGQTALDQDVEDDVRPVEPGLRPRAVDVVDLHGERGAVSGRRARRREPGQGIGDRMQRHASHGGLGRRGAAGLR